MNSEILTKLMTLISKRDHSEKELFQKLSKKFTSKEEINEVIQYAKERGWISPPDDLSEKVAQTLQRKNKGQLYINSYLREKGLPEIRLSEEEQLLSAIKLLERKRYHLNDKDDCLKAKRFLSSRGYLPSLISKAISICLKRN